MKLTEVKKNWDEFGKQDPLWSILTKRDKKGNRWGIEEFFKTGEEEIEFVLNYLDFLDVSYFRGRALDFGCGVGRLTQALCKYFNESWGVDIAVSMVELAEQYNRYGDRCKYYLNEANDLSLFANNSFNLIYSRIVLQHMSPEYSKNYIKEFLRVLAPGGVLVFQIPGEPAPSDSVEGLADSAYRAQITLAEPLTTAEPGKQAVIQVKVKNVSDTIWPSFVESDEKYDIVLANHWLNESEEVIEHDDGREALPKTLLPMEEVEIPLTISIPTEPGNYVLELDLVHEHVAWFAWRGSETLKVYVQVKHTKNDVWDLSFSGSNPDVSPSSNQNFIPKMEMYGVKKNEILEYIANCGGKVLDVQPDLSAGQGWLSFLYCVTKIEQTENSIVLQQNDYSLSEDLSLEQIENIYFNVVLKPSFYGDDYTEKGDFLPFKELALIIDEIFHPQQHLDIGCGQGLLVLAMRSLKKQSRGIDFSEDLLNKSAKSIRQYLDVATAEDWLLKASLEELDLITFTEVFEHIPVSLLEQIIKSLYVSYSGRLFLTIPSYGLDPTFKLGIQVNDNNASWQRDMMENRPFKNIVLENGVPHHGHITLASYRWWTEFFLFHGYSRNRDLETTCNSKFHNIIKAYSWNPYILERTQDVSQLSKCLETGMDLDSGWHNYEQPSKGRWTNGSARIYFYAINLRANVIKLSISTPEINYIMWECNLLITLENLVRSNSYEFKWATIYTSGSTEITRKTGTINLEIKLLELSDDNDHQIASDCWRVNIISPYFCPSEYGLSTDSRHLGVMVHSVELL